MDGWILFTFFRSNGNYIFCKLAETTIGLAVWNGRLAMSVDIALSINVAILCKRNSLFMGLLVVENQSGRTRANQVAREKCAQRARHELLRVRVRG